MLEGANRSKYGRIIIELSNDFVKGATTYPKTVEDALEMLSTWSNHHEQGQQRKQKAKRGAAFAQKKKIVCYNCGEEGHIAPKCPKKRQENNREARESSHVSNSGETAQQQQQQQEDS